eukprot:gene4553-53376_t
MTWLVAGAGERARPAGARRAAAARYAGAGSGFASRS